MKSATIALFALTLLTPLAAWSEQYRLDPAATEIEFSIQSFGLFSIDGIFSRASGELSFDAATPQSMQASVSIETGSVQTGRASRDQELRGADFFASDIFPTLVFHSSSLTKTGDQTALLMGEVTLRGITRPMQLEVIFGSPRLPPTLPGEPPHPRIAFSAKGHITRSEFGMTRYLPFLSDRVTLSISAEAVNY
jgi:polyisoprenoid-binding protein YceI